MLWYPEKISDKENEKIDTRYPYALTKNLGEQLVLHWNKVYKLNVISMRFLMFMVLDPEHQGLTVQCLVFF